MAIPVEEYWRAGDVDNPDGPTGTALVQIAYRQEAALNIGGQILGVLERIATALEKQNSGAENMLGGLSALLPGVGSKGGKRQ